MVEEEKQTRMRRLCVSARVCRGKEAVKGIQQQEVHSGTLNTTQAARVSEHQCGGPFYALLYRSFFWLTEYQIMNKLLVVEQ